MCVFFLLLLKGPERKRHLPNFFEQRENSEEFLHRSSLGCGFFPAVRGGGASDRWSVCVTAAQACWKSTDVRVCVFVCFVDTAESTCSDCTRSTSQPANQIPAPPLRVLPIGAEGLQPLCYLKGGAGGQGGTSYFLPHEPLDVAPPPLPPPPQRPPIGPANSERRCRCCPGWGVLPKAASSAPSPLPPFCLAGRV